MPLKKHHIKLEACERAALQRLANSQKAAALKVQRAKAMLEMDCGENGPALSDSKTAIICGLSVRSLERLRRRVCEVGPLGALEREPRMTPPVEPKVTGEVEAQMVKIACSDAPKDCARWTLNLIAERLVELNVVDSISRETVRTTLKKTTLNHGVTIAGVSRRKTTRPS